MTGISEMYRKALYFWSLGTSLYLELFCFLSFVSFVYVTCAPVPTEGTEIGTKLCYYIRIGDFCYYYL